MNVCVLGGGVIGVTTAYLLAREGCQVTVVEQHRQVGHETSFANGAQLCYSYVAPLAAPSVFSHLPKWLFDRNAPLRFLPSLDPDQWVWSLKFLLQCTSERSRQSTVELHRLSAYSKQVMDEILSNESIDFDFTQTGKLVIYRDADDFAAARRQVEIQSWSGVVQTVLDAQSCVEKEPALQSMEQVLAGGIFTPTEGSGDCYVFTRELARISAAKYGVNFVNGTKLLGLRQEGDRIVAARTSGGDVNADFFVVALGNGSREALAPLGVRLPLLPLKGYSLTLPIGEKHAAPTISVTDVHHKIVYARLGSRLRIAGMVDMTPAGYRDDPRRVELLKAQAQSVMPNAGDFTKAEVWTGFRPATPDGRPVLGCSEVSNLRLNAGHGALGFTLACASARLVVDEICGLPTALDLAPYSLTGRNSRRQYGAVT
ncbi:D-amino acid dehydrogenase [Paraburkholderia sp. J8-2]|uniref:D-amino acid dehydrogenase n=1 Tax=Paraburkholderia sp. J8-2 TaxID=2805440 RepID=UPI002AB74417|nr:D-amino acid dehydrogenase [Paraburkholderia sp. J8-2]